MTAMELLVIKNVARELRQYSDDGSLYENEAFCEQAEILEDLILETDPDYKRIPCSCSRRHKDQMTYSVVFEGVFKASKSQRVSEFIQTEYSGRNLVQWLKNPLHEFQVIKVLSIEETVG